MDRFDLAIFDLDGTLIDSRGDIADSLNAALGELGLPTHGHEEIGGMIGDGVGVLVERALAAPDRGKKEAVRTAFLRIYGSNLVVKTRLYDGIAALLERATAAGLPLCINTNKPGDWAREIALRLGVADRFCMTLGDGDGVARKPDPAGVREILACCKAGPGRALYVGDSLVDIATARAASVPVAAVSWGYTPRDRLAQAKPDRLLDQVADLGALLGVRQNP